MLKAKAIIKLLPDNGENYNIYITGAVDVNKQNIPIVEESLPSYSLTLDGQD